MYELPSFTASIDVQPYVAFTDISFQVRISVDYTFGKSMHGDAKVQFLRFGQLVIYERNLRLGVGSDTGTIFVNIANDLGVRFEERVDIVLEFTDAMSNKKINATSHINIHGLSTLLAFEAPESFRRGENFNFQIEAKRYDGSPVIIYTTKS